MKLLDELKFLLGRGVAVGKTVNPNSLIYHKKDDCCGIAAIIFLILKTNFLPCELLSRKHEFLHNLVLFFLYNRAMKTIILLKLSIVF